VLLIHGMPTNGRLWDDVVHELARHFQCFVIDLPGMGSTPSIPYGPSYLSDVAAQIEQVRMRHRVQRWHIVGHDAGCAAAVQYAHLYPKRIDCLALISPSIFPDLKPFFLLRLLRKPVIGELSAPLIHILFWKVAMRRAVPDATRRASFRKDYRGLRGPWKLMRLVRWGSPKVILRDLPSFLHALDCPTLVVHGSDDILPESFARRAADLLPNSKLITLKSGHFIPIQQANALTTSLLGCFKSPAVKQKEGCQTVSRDKHQAKARIARPRVGLAPAAASR
jgi:pimeloyl-ACP methyl ester carboxylesterase